MSIFISGRKIPQQPKQERPIVSEKYPTAEHGNVSIQKTTESPEDILSQFFDFSTK